MNFRALNQFQLLEKRYRDPGEETSTVENDRSEIESKLNSIDSDHSDLKIRYEEKLERSTSVVDFVRTYYIRYRCPNFGRSEYGRK